MQLSLFQRQVSAPALQRFDRKRRKKRDVRVDETLESVLPEGAAAAASDAAAEVAAA